MGSVHDSRNLLALAPMDVPEKLFPPNAKPINDNPPSSAFASAAVDATLHLMQNYDSSSVDSRKLFQNQPGTRSETATSKMARQDPPRQRKLCFVTVGATAPFDVLIDACQTPEFLSALDTAGYTNLLIQHGHKGRTDAWKDLGSLRMTSFDFRKDGISREMRAARGDMRPAKADFQSGKPALPGLDFGKNWDSDIWEEGVVISHAGSGSILDALRVSVPLIVVPNEKLLDNHQVELAEELSKQGYVIHGRVEDLTIALREAELLRQKRKSWPPPVDKSVDPSGKGLIGIMDEEMGYHDLKHSRPGGLHLD